MMKYLRFSLLPILLFIFISGFSQEISGDSIHLNLTIHTHENRPLETGVLIKSLTSGKTKKYKSDNTGLAKCVLITGEDYTIKITDSEDSYEYSIPDFSISPLELTLKFSSQPSSSSSYIFFYNKNPNQKEFSLKTKNSVTPYKITSDTSRINLTPAIDYAIDIKGVNIKNNFIKIRPDIPVNYILHFLDDKNAELLPVRTDEAALQILYTNLEGLPNINEPIQVSGGSSKSSYKLNTGKNGSAFIILPTPDSYKISLRYFPNIYSLDVKRDPSIIYTNTLRLKFPSSVEIEKQKKDDSLRLLNRDIFYAKREKALEVPLNSITTNIKADASKAFDELAKNPQYFIESDNVVCAALSRNDKIWKTKMIVTDVTGSMYPYIKQVALWHMLELLRGNPADYVFFNDGDNRSNLSKVIGSTGGIYINLNNIPDSVISTMDLSMSKGNGGDGPENNIEALLVAESNLKSGSELIMVADNFSSVKDIELLDKLNTPVRIIVCGSTNDFIHPDYLKIAYKTGGSIHTLEEDILNLSSLLDEATITIRGKTYKFIRGQFFLIS